jgi:hypothetical protein
LVNVNTGIVAFRQTDVPPLIEAVGVGLIVMVVEPVIDVEQSGEV